MWYFISCILLNSENKIFGKFEAFSRRLSEIGDLLVVIEGLRPLLTLHSDDTSEVITTYQAMLDSIQQWTGDPADPRNKQVIDVNILLPYWYCR